MSNNAGNNTGGGSALGNVPPKVWLYVIGIPVVVGGAYFGIIRPIMKKFNILKTNEDKQIEQVAMSMKTQPYWSSSYYMSVNNGVKPLTDSRASEFAKNINYAMKGGLGWGTDESAIYGAIDEIKSKAGISQVAETYYNKYNASMLSDLIGELNDEDFTEIGRRIAKYY